MGKHICSVVLSRLHTHHECMHTHAQMHSHSHTHPNTLNSSPHTPTHSKTLFRHDLQEHTLSHVGSHKLTHRLPYSEDSLARVRSPIWRELSLSDAVDPRAAEVPLCFHGSSGIERTGVSPVCSASYCDAVSTTIVSWLNDCICWHTQELNDFSNLVSCQSQLQAPGSPALLEILITHGEELS